MYQPELDHKISPKFVRIRIISELIGNILGFVVLFVLYGLDQYFDWPNWIGLILIGLLVLNVVGTIWSLFEPKYLYRNWGYQIGYHE
ncbi:hypothetical protein [Tenuibacillus multivorans]|uniref:Uncharacterized protein n=1 Tax=Tenuibacillus multivorans TaxID=237069 RepID=A0A1H0BTP8_9BACI|nr:hypothetical protein [Tenuibacillus multivorans]GEL77040.1 hypothetical protein TMU01_12750 [Tenuibacillus multivorans]SDN48945.1 hypothetical protein SAMN05216498_2382 [Tenuibacillus multivorans]